MRYSGLLAVLIIGSVAAVSAVETAGEAGADRPAIPGPSDLVLFKGHRIPAMVLTKKGTLLAFAERRWECSDHGNVDLVLRRSTDGGGTWGGEILVHDAGKVASGNPCPVVDRTTGTVWVAFASDNNKLALVTHSDDDGLTWAKPTDITGEVKLAHWEWYAFGPCHGIQLKSGRMIFPCNHTCPKGKSVGDHDPWGARSHTVYTDDHGRTWKLGGTVGGEWTNENSVTELADGSLYLNSRRGGGRDNHRIVALSRDGGETWSAGTKDPVLTEPTQFGTGCQGSAIRLTGAADHDRNRVLFSCPPGPEREDVTIRVSYDECKTWKHSKVLMKGPGGYSDLVVFPDMSIGCLYEGKGGIHFARFTLEWLTDGKDKVVPKREAAPGKANSAGSAEGKG